MYRSIAVFSLLGLFVFQFFRPTFEYLEINGSRERYDLQRVAELQGVIGDGFLTTCQVVPGAEEHPLYPAISPYYAYHCDEVWEKADFELPEQNLNNMLNSECFVEDVYDLMNRERLMKASLDEISEHFPCPPRYLGSLMTYRESFSTFKTPFVIREITSLWPAGRLHLYAVSSGDSTRYLWFQNGQLQKLMGWSYDWRLKDHAKRQARPKTVPTSHNLFTKAMIALGRANANGCGSFTLDWDGNAECNDGGKWKIDFLDVSAYKR